MGLEGEGGDGEVTGEIHEMGIRSGKENAGISSEGRGAKGKIKE